MTIQLPVDAYFTDQNDIVPMSEEAIQPIVNSGVTYTLAGNDQITGTSTYFDPNQNLEPFLDGGTGFINYGDSIINTGNGRDVITGNGLDGEDYGHPSYHGYGIHNRGSIETGDDGDYLISYGTFNNSGMVSLGDGNDELFAKLVVPRDSVTNNSRFILLNYGTIESGNGDDYFSIVGRFNNSGRVSLGYGNDYINLNGYDNYPTALENYQIIETEDGDDRIFTDDAIHNQGIINTGNGQDSFIAYKGFSGNGNVYLGNGEDYLKGFGNGYYEGGNDQDSLDLTSLDTYTIEMSGAVVSFIKTGGYGQTMHTLGFERLIAGSRTYDFTNLYDGQTILAYQ